MREHAKGLLRLRIAFALLSIALLAVLAIAPATTYFSEWRAAQQRYNVLAQRAKLTPIDVGVRQLSTPTPESVDRCGSCHLGAAGVTPVDGDPLFAAHPPIPHDPARFGCTICHGGQGRAVAMQAAHVGGSNWDEPLFPPRYREAGCGVCHSRVPTPDPTLVAPGHALFESRGCTACHSVDGSGDVTKHDLSQIGLRGYSREWQDQHLRDGAHSTDARWSKTSLPLPEEERAAIEAYLKSLIGAPQLMGGKLQVARSGCRGCHRIGGVGGDGPDLSDIGSRRLTDLDFSHVRGEHTLAGWLRELLTDPSRVDSRSRMPATGLSPAEIDQVVTYLLSLKARPVSAAFSPPDRVKGMQLGERDYAIEGRPLFLTFCSACHGPRGEGRSAVLSSSEQPCYFCQNVMTDVVPEATAPAPAIGGAAFLAIANDAFMMRTLRQGRQRGMPAWGSWSGLSPEEIAALLGYLRTLQPAPPSFAEVSAAELDLPHGRTVFHDSCAPCHGTSGEGSAIGPPLAAADNPVTTRSDAIYGTLMSGIDDTAMGSFRTFDARTLRAVIGAVQELERKHGPRADWRPRAGDPERGREIFGRVCVNCHRSQSKAAAIEAPRIVAPGPAIEDRRFLAAALDSFLTASVVRRHDRSREDLRRSPEEVADLVAYLRSLGPMTPHTDDR